MQREVVDVRQRQRDTRGVKQRVRSQRPVHHGRRAGLVVETAERGVGALESGDHFALPQ